jgi:hypothetical protein
MVWLGYNSYLPSWERASFRSPAWILPATVPVCLVYIYKCVWFRCLLLKLVERSLGSKHPQLMLRRTESIVEKMLTNWLALCLYDYMKDYAGSSLFVLFKAIKFQVSGVTPLFTPVVADPDPGSRCLFVPGIRDR